MAMQTADNFHSQINQTCKGQATPAREIGYLDRVQGLSSGVDKLADMMSEFSCRINGVPADVSGDGSPLTINGLGSSLSDAESALRRCFEIMKHINDAF